MKNLFDATVANQVKIRTAQLNPPRSWQGSETVHGAGTPGEERMTNAQRLLAQAYSAFNRRDIDGALALMSETIDWPKASEGGRVVGKEEIRAYWTRQWAEFNPHVEPMEITDGEAGRTEVKVHQLVKNLSGDILSDQTLFHVFTIANGLIERMDIGESKPAFGQGHAG